MIFRNTFCTYIYGCGCFHHRSFCFKIRIKGEGRELLFHLASGNLEEKIDGPEHTHTHSRVYKIHSLGLKNDCINVSLAGYPTAHEEFLNSCDNIFSKINILSIVLLMF
jgi:hypothetical protein